MSFVVGIELGQVSDVTAIAVVECLTLPFLRVREIRERNWVNVVSVYRAPDGREVTEHPPVNFALRHLERIPAGASYPDVLRRVEELWPKLQKPRAVLDATGVGRAATDLFRHSKLYPHVFTLTAGDQMTQEGSYYRIPKRDVVSVTQVLLQTGRLKIARTLPHADLLARELVNFRFRTGGPQSPDQLDWREGPHDDLVLALAIASWEAERNPGIGFSIGYSVSEFSGLGLL